MQGFVFYVLSLCTVLASSSPQVQLHKTTVVGRDVTGLKQDFFGGMLLHMTWRSLTQRMARHTVCGTTPRTAALAAISMETISSREIFQCNRFWFVLSPTSKRLAVVYVRS